MTKRIILRLGAALFLIALGALGQSKAERIDALLAAYQKHGRFNGAALVAESGHVIHKKGYGMANVEWGIPNSPDTRFRIGSITKQFTAALILHLANEGKIELESPIGRYLPDYPRKVADKVTVHHLLNHTSGIPSYTGLPDFFSKHSRDPYSVSDFIKVFSSLDLEFEPGTKHRYNNSGYFLLGAIIEQVTGERYEDVLRKRIFEPLRMSGSGYDHWETIIPKRAAGYDNRLDGFRTAPYLDMSLPYAAGSLYATVEDLYTWDQALYGDTVLPPAWKERMFTPTLEDYAYGWVVHEVEKTGKGSEKVRVHEHGGGINGFNTLISRIPSEKHLIVLFSNAGGAPLTEMASGIRTILYGGQAASPPQPGSRLLYEVYAAKGTEAALAAFRERKSAGDQQVDLSQRELRRFVNYLSDQKKHKDAVASAKLGTELFPGDWAAHFDLGEALREAGENAEARKSYGRALQAAPEAAAGMVIQRIDQVKP